MSRTPGGRMSGRGRPAAPDAALLQEAARLQEAMPIVLMHTDLIADVAERRSLGERRVMARRHAGLLRSASVQCISDHVIGDTFECYCFPTRDVLYGLYTRGSYGASHLKHSLKLLEAMLRDIDESVSDFAVVRSVPELRAANAQGKIGVVLCFQGVTPIEDEPALLQLYHRLGMRVVGLVTRHGNAAAGSNSVNAETGLTRLGRHIVDMAHDLRMVLDAADLSKRAFWELVDGSERPVVASHTNCAALCSYPGNLDDDQLRGLASIGGVIGLHVGSPLVKDGPGATLGDFVDHIDHAVDVMGIDHVGIGPDLVEPTWYPSEAYERIYADVGFWTPDYPEGIDHLTDLRAVIAELLARGYDPNAVAKIFGGNVLRAYAAVWDAAAVPQDQAPP